jgi:hypothetical protein
VYKPDSTDARQLFPGQHLHRALSADDGFHVDATCLSCEYGADNGGL